MLYFCVALVGEEPFVVMLSDVLVDDALSSSSQDNLADMIKACEVMSKSQVMVEAVPDKYISQYGIVDCGGHFLNPSDSIAMRGIVEKLY
jgi:UTP--glucose-1-phosphate uridylyltransferase